MCVPLAGIEPATYNLVKESLYPLSYSGTRVGNYTQVLTDLDRIEFTVDRRKTAIIFALSQRVHVKPRVTEQEPRRFISVGLLYVKNFSGNLMCQWPCLWWWV